jgi:hypothetical protein
MLTMTRLESIPYVAMKAGLPWDYDGTPMVTDVMGDETCRNLARELGRRNSGFMQLSRATVDPFHDLKEVETLAELSHRPLLFQALMSFDRERKSIGF